MPTTVNSRNGNEPTNKSKKGRNLQQPPCSHARTTGILPPLRCPQHFQKPNYPPAENQRRPRTHYLCYRIDMISGAIKQDYGKHDDVFRAAYHHEPVATDYKVDGELICAEVPRLALCLSGTPANWPTLSALWKTDFTAVSASTPAEHDGNTVRRPPSKDRKIISHSTRDSARKYWRCTSSSNNLLRKSR